MRERPDDVPALINHFVERYCKENHIPIPRFDPALIAYLSKLQWKGNIRQLENTLIRMLVLNHKTLTLKDIPEEIHGQEHPILQEALNSRLTLEEMNRMYVNLVYEHTNKNKKTACEFLDVNYRTLMKRLKKA
ncbi:MAG: hypothetical protein P8X42_10650 [Calditrichaceae bacterium]